MIRPPLCHPGIYQRKESLCPQDTYKFISAPFARGKNRKQSEGPSTGGRINRPWAIRTAEVCVAIRRVNSQYIIQNNYAEWKKADQK